MATVVGLIDCIILNLAKLVIEIIFLIHDFFKVYTITNTRVESEPCQKNSKFCDSKKVSFNLRNKFYSLSINHYRG